MARAHLFGGTLTLLLCGVSPVAQTGAMSICRAKTRSLQMLFGSSLAQSRHDPTFYFPLLGFPFFGDGPKGGRLLFLGP